MPDEEPPGGPKSHRSINAVIVGIVCALLGAFGGCTGQFLHDISGGHGGPVYILSGLAIGAVVGLIAAAAIRERDR